MNIENQAKEYAPKYSMSAKDMENVLRSMTIECIDFTEENIQEYLEDYDTHRINIKISKNTQRILSNFKEGRETYEDVLLRLITPKEILKVGHVDFQVEIPHEPFEVVQKGFVDLSTITDENPRIMFYDAEGNPSTQPRGNPYQDGTEKCKEWSNTMTAWLLDEDFIKTIWEHRDEDTMIFSKDYILIINEGE